MQTKFVGIIFSLILLSCNNQQTNERNNADNQLTQHTDILKNKNNTDTESINQRPLFHQISHDVIFIANGTEPGWLLTLYSDKFQFIANYGKDTIEEKLNLDIHNMPVQYKSDKLSFLIDKKTCIAISGDTLSYTVKIIYDKNELNGCGKKLK